LANGDFENDEKEMKKKERSRRKRSVTIEGRGGALKTSDGFIARALHTTTKYKKRRG